MPVDGEYCLSTKEQLIRGETTPAASAKIHAALFFVEPPLQPRRGPVDEPETSRPLCESPQPNLNS
jgi:hypothetical protein